MIAGLPSDKRLISLPAGEKGVIKTFCDDSAGSKLVSVGILPGSFVELVRKAPLGGGWYVKVDGQTFALRQEEATCIVIE
ncbi:MAG: ferrous iron transport protein A [Saprospiraceae bacterium]